jgi:hypothetical protein
MTTVSAFNEMMGQFLEELVQTFPDESTLKEVAAAPRDRGTLDTFLKQIGPWVNQMMAKDDAFFSDQNEFVARIGLVAIWKSELCTPNTKAAIWQYLQTLYMLATTINMFPPETLSMIESAAENCAKNIQAGGGALDERSLMAGMNNMLAQMMGGGGNPFGAALGGQEAEPAAHRDPRRPPRPKLKGRTNKK